MSTTKQREPLKERLEQGLLEGIGFAASGSGLVTTVVPVGRSYLASEVAEIRKRRHMTQAQFANLLAVSVKTLQSWEQGARKPSRPTMRLLQIFDSPEAFRGVFVVREREAKYDAEPASPGATLKQPKGKPPAKR